MTTKFVYKVVYNACNGGFSISLEALKRMQELGFRGAIDVYKGRVALYKCERHHPILVQVVEELGDKANTRASELRIAEVSGPYRIEKYDGAETVYEPGNYNWITP